MPEDRISRIICNDLNVRAFTVTSHQTVAEIIRIHQTTPNATYALGRSVTAGALLGATLKPESRQSIVLKFFGDGPIREVHVQADAAGNVRGYVANPEPDLAEDLGGINFSRAIGAGFISVIKDLGMKEPYTSTMPLVYGDVAGDVSYYLAASEQVPSALIIALELDREGAVSASGGILIQTFPETEQGVIDRVDEKIRNMPASLGEHLLNGRDIHAVLSELLDNRPVDILAQGPLRASCRCSREMLVPVLMGLEREELQDMIEKDGGAEVVCTFCRNVYSFTEDDLRGFMKERIH